MKKVLIAFAVFAFCASTFAGTPGTLNSTAKKIVRRNTLKEAAAFSAQKNTAAVSPIASATSSCSYTFTSGTANTYLKFCVTVNGNITQLETPAGQEHIAVGAYGEGYGVCDATSNVGYYDYADFGDSGNWLAPVTTHPAATVVKVVRSTSDGIWTLTQSITQVAGSSSIKIAMTLKNNTAIARRGFLVRYADVDASGVFLNNFDSTTNSAWGNNSLFGYGLMLQNVGNPVASNGWIGISQNVASGPDPCNIYANQAGPISATDGSIALLWDNTFAAHVAKTYTATYKGL